MGAIGIQSHMGMEPVGIPKVLTALDRMAQFGLPLVITEFDQPTSDERLQGRYMRDFMTAVFSHPAVDSFIMWGFWEGRHWRPEAALFREDWSVKPNGQAYLDLVFGQWRTEETGRTDAQGSHRTRGFLGDYIVRVRHEGRTLTRSVTLGRDGVTSPSRSSRVPAGEAFRAVPGTHGSLAESSQGATPKLALGVSVKRTVTARHPQAPLEGGARRRGCWRVRRKGGPIQVRLAQRCAPKRAHPPPP